MAEKKKPGRRRAARGGPMQLTASSGYAIHGLAYLALKGADSVTFLSEISEFFAIPPSYLAKVFQTLARQRLVSSYRGAKGGYALARPPDGITLREVIEIFEGRPAAECPLLKGPCSRESQCQVYRRLMEAQQAYLGVLEGHTVADIAEEFGDKDGKAGPGRGRGGRKG
jgi:Rrf2 family protein